ncbi:hypothetical protein L7F22_055858 [Adiantum nelumboides]|nr:hypothetical protein [Adiantum nelumboides]
MSSSGVVTEPRVVVAVDFGTTFSGFAYAKFSEPDEVFKVYEWPGASRAGAKPYCKTQTSLFYAPPPAPGLPFRLLDWGWSGLLAYTQASRSAAKLSHVRSLLPALNHLSNEGADVLALPPELEEKVGFFATKFKLLLAPDVNPTASTLPRGLTVERLVVDYLQCLSRFILSELQVNYGKHFGMEDVQWCLTVPAIWDERAKQVMKVCAEKAGMVKGASCPTSIVASPFPLGIILEPEAASVYCQQKAKGLNLVQGNKLLVADVGGGTIDLVVHQKADNDPNSMKVHEFVGSYGDIGGGTFVDNNFFQHLCHKIGCFKEFCRNNPSLVLRIFEWWQGIKAGFDGKGFSAQFSLPRKLSEAWEEYDNSLGIHCHDEDYYDEFRLEDTEITAIFDTEVEKVLSLIKKQVNGIRVLMVVGGFSASPYLRKRIQRAFQNMVEEVIIPEDPGSAICHGAVLLHMRKDIIKSRIAKRTYGVRMCREVRRDDPLEFRYVNDDGILQCDNCMDVFVTVGSRVPFNESIRRSYCPNSHGQRTIRFELYSSPNKCVEYTNDVDVVKEGSFTVDISEGVELDKSRSLDATMVFGGSLIQVSATRVNFGHAAMEHGLSIAFEQA